MSSDAASAPPAAAPEVSAEVPVSDLQHKFFGFQPATFFNAIFSACDEQIGDGMDAMEVAMLPSFAATEREEMKGGNDKLIELICTTMDKNMDKFEIYSTRNIFSIPEEVQQLIMEEIAAGATQGTPGKKAKTSATDSPSAASASEGTTSIPKSVDDLPSKDDTLKLDQELVELRNKLRTVKKSGHQLKAAAEKLQALVEKATKSSDGVAAAISAGSESIGAPLHDTVSAVVMGKDGLAQLKEEGMAIVNQMAEDEEDEENENNTSTISMEGKFAAAKSAIGGSSARDISNLTNILKK